MVAHWPYMATATFLQERRWPCGHCRISVTTAQGPPLNNCDRWYKFTHCPFGQIPNFCGIKIFKATIDIKNILIPLTNSDATSRCSRKKIGIRSRPIQWPYMATYPRIFAKTTWPYTTTAEFLR